MKFIVDNMTCKHCQIKIEKALKDLGVKKIKIDLELKVVTVALKKHTKEEVEATILNIDYNFKEIE
ncbi:MAG: heavy-metal-associated domain-containing protein [Tenericutes bacterium]|nr:heavy-metal-associated domain-containing protein [Mycoplasmatota bacterium]